MRPNSAIAVSMTSCTCVVSRVSATMPRHRRSSASTSFTVSSRSAGTAIGYGTVASWSTRSNTTMSAPSRASRTAWLRP